ncbi:BTAD domain-containing putative transcriptional regulator [Dactylosporangium sp. McL0621]|uniref:BTAD domain-containing putative transcriptional regulator n=1 Tax=Dactylosporangium sp. McL0621 TaxID=3415678 RepID=UPI003CF7F676
MRVGLLGPLSVEVSGRPVEVGGARLRALLARLALEPGRFVAVERLVEALWPGGPGPADPANAVQSLVSRLRKALGNPPELESGPRGYRLGIEPGDVDAVRFERLVAEGRRALRDDDRAGTTRLLREALDLWRGAALADLGAADTDAVAARWAELRLAATEDLIEASGFAPDTRAGAIAELQELIVAHPLRERLVALLVRALHSDGRQAEALAAFEGCRARLAEQLGADPSPELRDAHIAVLRAEAGPRRGGNLRAALTSFVGRTGDVERLAVQVADSRLVTLVGPGGAGKTRLAATVAAELGRQLPDGAWLVELAPVAEATEVPAAALRTLIAGGLVQPEVAGRLRRGDVVEQLADALVLPGMLLILDNCEHVVDAAAGLSEELLGRCPKLRILATSREPLGILGETLFPVGPLPLPAVVFPAPGIAPAPFAPGAIATVGAAPTTEAPTTQPPTAKAPTTEAPTTQPPTAKAPTTEAPTAKTATTQAPMTTAPMTKAPVTGETVTGAGTTGAKPNAGALAAAVAAPAVQLLRDRAAAVRPGFEVTPDNVAAVVEICRRLDGLPLAIELAAARLRSFTPEQLASRLGDRFRLLTGGSRTALPRHRTLHAVVAWSWDLLGAGERAFAESLAVFPGTFDADAAHAAASGGGSDDHGRLAADAALAAHAAHAAASGGGSDDHGRLAADAAHAAASGGGSDDHGRLAADAAHAAASGGGSDDHGRLAAEEMLHTLVDRSLLQVVPGGAGPIRYRMLETIREFALEELGRRGAVGAVRAAHAAYFLELMERAEPHLRTAAQLEWLERLRPEQDNVHAAVGHLCDAGDVVRAFRLGAASGWFWTFEDNHAESALWLGRIIEAGRRDPAAVPSDLGLVVRSMHLVNSGFAGDFQFDRAELDALIAEAVAEPPGGHPIVELIAPVVALFRDDTEHGTALVRARLAGPIDQWSRGMLHSVLGHLCENDGNIDGMLRELTISAAAFRDIGERWGLSMTLASLADAYTRRGDFAAALAHFEESIELHRRLGIRSSEAYLLVSRAALSRHTEGPAVARARLRAFVEDLGQSSRDVSHAMLELGHLARAEGDLIEAERLYHESWRLQQESPLVAPQYKAIVVTARAEIDLARGEPGAARARLVDAMAFALGARDMPVVGKVAVTVAGLAAALGDPERGAATLGAAQRLAGARDASNADWTGRLAALRDELGEEAFKTALARGMSMPRAEALELVNPSSVPDQALRR